MKYIKFIAVLLSISLTACTGSGASYMAISGNTYSSISGKSPLIRTNANTSQIPSVAEAVTSNTNFKLTSSFSSLNSPVSSGALESTTSSMSGTSCGTGTPAGQTPADTSSRPAQQTSSSTTTSKPTSPTSSAAPANPTKPTNNTTTSSQQTTSTKPSDPPPPPPASSAAPKTAYDKPYDISQIRADMIAYAQSKGLTLKTSLYVQNIPPDYPSNGGYSFPMDTRDNYTTTQFKQFCRDEIDYLITSSLAYEPNLKMSDITFNVVILPLAESPGDYRIFIPYG